MNAAEKDLGERIRATVVAIYLFKARNPSAVNEPESLRRDAESFRAYPISSKRHLQEMRSELDATIREMRRQVARGYWPRRTFDLLAAHLRDEGFIDISTWNDTDAAKMKKVLESGEIRTVAQWRLATEYRDTVDDAELLRQIDDLIGLYEAKRNVRRSKASSPRTASTTQSTGSKLTSDDPAFGEVLRRSAVVSYEYAATRDEATAEDKRRLESQAETWRTFEVTTRRDIKDMEKAFWICLSNLRDRLTDEQFQQLTQRLQEEGLMDLSDLVKSRNRRVRGSGP